MAIEQMDSQGEEHLHAKLGGSAISLGGSAAASWAHRSPIHQTEAEERLLMMGIKMSNYFLYKILEMKEGLVRVCIRYDGLKLVNAADHLESALVSGLEVLKKGKRVLPKSKRDGQPHIYFSNRLCGFHRAAIYAREMVWTCMGASVEEALKAVVRTKEEIEALEPGGD
ncbi:hypothetical protein KEM48_009057 [Puccinia striiformis f. sp. tritici PST-130]|uniref:Uncharacterized protein n=1 Tax=Puccinia striiformis f. sp. tritici PST-78 TaxID=1165861 RepID=A0A0L0VNR4_9BASI|nr:hypothetical protein KEM48_009057 [Puccinia striiformis f. sp. tritici PST-130]KNF00923.1 hypothetical protein PSTG_05820 [Puccinia striiformis f. sp. tritici PST-78]